MQDRQTIKIFLASSSEVREERNHFDAVLIELNKSYKHLYLEPVRWEMDLMKGNQPGFTNLQDAINPNLNKSQLAVFIFYSRLGQFTKEEFDLATASGMKYFVYFKTNFSPQKDTIEAYTALLDFKAGLDEWVYKQEFTKVSDFGTLLYQDLNHYLSEHFSAPALQAASVNLSESLNTLIKLLAAKDEEIRQLKTSNSLLPAEEVNTQLQALAKEKSQLQQQLMQSQEMQAQQAAEKAALETRLKQHETANDLRRQALEEVEKGDYPAAESFLKKSTAALFANAASRMYELAGIKKLQLQYKEALHFLDLAAKTAEQNSLYFSDAASLATEMGHYDAAVAYLTQAITLNNRQHGEDYAATAGLYNNLGLAYNSKGDYKTALAYFDKSLQINLKNFGPNHPSVAICYNNQGMTFFHNGRYDDAIIYYKKALDIYQQYYDEDHADVATAYSNIGLAYNNMANYDAAISYLEKALAIDKQLSETETPNMALRYNNFGLANYGKKEFLKAIDYFSDAIRIYRQFYGEMHPALATCYNNMGEAYRSLKNNGRAIDLYKKSIEIYRHLYTIAPPEMAKSYNNLGIAYLANGTIDDAEAYFEEALLINRRYYGELHAETGVAYNNLGAVWESRGNGEKALHYYRQAMEILQASLPETHPTVVQVRENINRAQSQMGAGGPPQPAQP